MVTAISLSGGGAKGDFEVGALHFLYQQGIRPDIICSTSVGSVNGLKLAEGELGPDKGLMGLTNLWLDLNYSSDMFADKDWLTNPILVMLWFRQYLYDHGAANPSIVEEKYAFSPLLKRLKELERTCVDNRLNFYITLPTLALQNGTGKLQPENDIASSLISATWLVGILAQALESEKVLEDAAKDWSFFTLDPIRKRAQSAVDLNLIAAWANSGKKLRMSTVGLRSGALRFVTETGLLVERDGFTPCILGRELILDPECQTLSEKVEALGERVNDVDLTREPGDGPRTPHSGGGGKQELLKQLAAAKAELENCQNAQPPHYEDILLTANLIDGMQASATIPTFFNPVKIGDDIYVDGGVREVIPIEVAGKCGANQVFAITASKSSIDRWLTPNEGDVNMFSIALRSLMDIAIDEVAQGDLHPPSGWGNLDVKFIEPREDIHTLYTVYPAFVRSRMAYGFMCAGDAISPPSDPAKLARAKEIADRIAILRYGIARLECWLNNQAVPPYMVVLPAIPLDDIIAVTAHLLALKSEIKDLVAERKNLGAVVPAGGGEWDNPELWWQQMEIHPWHRS